MFDKKTWEDRIVENPGRRKLVNIESGEATTVDVSREEGNVSRTGTSFSAANMNDLEDRIYKMFPCSISNGGTGSTTLTQARSTLGILSKDILYNNTSGTKSTISIQRQLVVYEYIDIEYTVQKRYMTARVYSPQGKSTTLFEVGGFVKNNDIMSLWRTCVINLSGRTIAFEHPREMWGYIINSGSPVVTAENDLSITKIIGYRY